MSPSVFGYGSLVSASSLAQTLGHHVGPVMRADLPRWKRRWSQARHNKTAEKVFALADGTEPEYILGLNLEPGEDSAGAVNGTVIELEQTDIYRLDLREMRYDRIDVTDTIEMIHRHSDPDPPIYAYVAKDANFAPQPPPGAVVLSAYLEAVEAAFESLGPGELDRYRATTGEPPVEIARATLVKDRIPPGNPRAW